MMSNAAHHPTRRFPRSLALLWFAAVICASLVGIAMWSITIIRLTTLQTVVDQQAMLNKPPVSEDDLAHQYQAGREAYTLADYHKAVTLFQQIYSARQDYKDTAAYLVLGYVTLGAREAHMPQQLTQAAADYRVAYTILTTQTVQIGQFFSQNPTMFPSGTQTLAALAQMVALRQATATNYAQANTAQTTMPGWWDTAIPLWEKVYQSDPTYLNDVPHYGIAERLAASYESKAVYVCQAAGNYSDAWVAVSRAQEIARSGSIPSSLQSAILATMLTITQSRCQGD